MLTCRFHRPVVMDVGWPSVLCDSSLIFWHKSDFLSLFLSLFSPCDCCGRGRKKAPPPEKSMFDDVLIAVEDLTLKRLLGKGNTQFCAPSLFPDSCERPCCKAIMIKLSNSFFSFQSHITLERICDGFHHTVFSRLLAQSLVAVQACRFQWSGRGQ